MTLKLKPKILIVATICLVGLILRLNIIDSRHSSQNNFGMGPYGDTFLYHNAAMNLLEFGSFTTDMTTDQESGENTRQPIATRGPVYPYFLSLLISVYGDYKTEKSSRLSFLFLRYSQAILGTLSILLVIWLGIAYTNLFSIGIIAGIIFALCPYNIYWVDALYRETFNVFLLLLCLNLIHFSFKNQSIGIGILSGILSSILVLDHPTLVLFFPFFILLKAFTKSKIPKTVGFAYAIAFLLTFVPWTVRNYQNFGYVSPLPKSGLGGALFWGAFENESNWQGWRKFPREIFKDIAEQEKIEKVYNEWAYQHKIGSIEILKADAILRDFAIERLLSNPAEVILNYFRNLPRLWNINQPNIYMFELPNGAFFGLILIVAFFSFKYLKTMILFELWAPFLYLSFILLPLHIEPRYGLYAYPGVYVLSATVFHHVFWELKEWIPLKMFQDKGSS